MSYARIEVKRMRSPVSFAVAFAVVLAFSTRANASPSPSPSPIPSLGALTTGNGFGFAVFDLKQSKITEFLEHPYRYLRPGATQMDLGVERRNLAYDVYFGVRANTTAAWLQAPNVSAANYVAESGIIHSAGTVGGVKADSYFFEPFGLSQNAMVALIHVTNNNASAVTVDAFLNPNFHMGSGTGDSVGADGETITTTGMSSTETGAGGGVMVYQPFGFDKADCSGTGYANVNAGMDLAGTPTTCSNQTDITIDYQKSLGSIAAGGDAWWGAVITFAADGNSSNASGAVTTWIGGRAPDKILADAQAEWEAWRKPPPSGLSADETRVWRQSESVLRMAQVLEPWTATPKQKAYGMILASLPPGEWHIGWVRDAQFAIVALARMGHLDEAKRGLEFFLGAEANQYQTYAGVPYRVSVVRYFGNGVEESDWNADGPNVEFDGWGLFLWAARTYVDRAGNGWLDGMTPANERYYDVLADQVAAPLHHNLEGTGLIGQDTSIWESHWNNRKHYAFTTLAAARGLCDFAALASRRGDSANASKYQTDSSALGAGARAHLVDSGNVLGGSEEGISAGKYHDAAPLWGLNWSLYPTSDAVWNATLDGLSVLQVSSGGYKRNDDALSSYDSDEWVMVDLTASMVMRKAGRAAAADSLVAWVTAQAMANQQLIPELYNQTSGSIPIDAYSGAIPMVGFGAAAYLLALLDRSGASPLDTACDTPFVGNPDGGLPPGNDSGTAPEGGDMSVRLNDAGQPIDPIPDLSVTPRHATGGCSCDVGGRTSAPPIAIFVGLGFWISRRRGRASRDRDRAAG
jgi:GH15 family glucan-1,4-alpha-glucosidase